MSGPDITNHYHGFGWNSGNNSGQFVAVNANSTFPLWGNTGRRGWNGSNGGGGYNSTELVDCNMVTTGAVVATQRVQTDAVQTLMIIKV